MNKNRIRQTKTNLRKIIANHWESQWLDAGWEVKDMANLWDNPKLQRTVHKLGDLSSWPGLPQVGFQDTTLPI